MLESNVISSRSLDADSKPFEIPARVFVLNMDYHDFSVAREFGDLVPVLMGRPKLDDLDQLRADIREVVEEAALYDYLLLSGPPIVIALGIEAWHELGLKQFLYYDGFEKSYKEYENVSEYG